MIEENKIELEKVNLIYIDDKFVDEIAKTIKNNLVSMCWGQENSDLFDYGETVTNFLDRIKDRPLAFKVGFVGEFLVHCYFKTFTNYTHLSVFLNDQDKSNKRGFDCMIYDDKKELWYVEVKSGSEENIKGEFSNNGVDNDISHTRGTISMARASDPDSASSQFFIVQADSTFLDGDYAGFGHVTEGMDIVDKICEDAKPTDDNGTIPSDQQPVIEKITITD